MKNRRLVRFAAALCFVPAFTVGWIGAGVAQQSKIPGEVWEKAVVNGAVRISVMLDVAFKPESELSP